MIDFLLFFFQVIRVLDAALFAVVLALGTVVLVSAHKTMKPSRSGLGLMWLHIVAVTFAMWGWMAAALIPIIHKIQAEAPPTPMALVYFALASLTAVSFYLILRVQRGRLALGGRHAVNDDPGSKRD